MHRVLVSSVLLRLLTERGLTMHRVLVSSVVLHLLTERVNNAPCSGLLCIAASPDRES